LKTLPENLQQLTKEEQTTGLKDLQPALEVAQALVPSSTRKASLRSAHALLHDQRWPNCKRSTTNFEENPRRHVKQHHVCAKCPHG
jgi:hypothetical protein